MNKHIHIRDFDGDLHELLVKNAASKDVSLTAYLKSELAKIAKTPTVEVVGEQLLNLPRNQIDTNWTRQSSARLVRESREERGEHLYRVFMRGRTKSK